MSPVLQALNPWLDEYTVKPLSYVNPVAVSDAAASGEAVAVAPPAAAAEPSHADQLQQLADLIAANNASCEDDVPLFLRQARRA